MLEMNRSRLIGNLSGAVSAGIAASALFSVFGYSGGATFRDFTNEFVVAIISFGSAALVLQYVTIKSRFALDTIWVSFFGALMSFVLKQTILEGANGFSAYIQQAVDQHSWKPIIDLIVRCFTFTSILVTFSFPFIALGKWIYFFGRKISLKARGLHQIPPN